MHTQRMINRTVEATAPDGIELFTKHVFQSIVEVGAVAASIVLGQSENNKIQKTVTLCACRRRHRPADCHAKVPKAKLIGPFSFQLVNCNTCIVVQLCRHFCGLMPEALGELQLLQAWGRSSTRR